MSEMGGESSLGTQNATRGTKDVLKTASFLQTDTGVERLTWPGWIPRWSGTEGFSGSCGSLCRERCAG